MREWGGLVDWSTVDEVHFACVLIALQHVAASRCALSSCASQPTGHRGFPGGVPVAPPVP